MELTISQEVKQQEMDRTYLKGTLSYSEKRTPGRQEVLRLIAEKKKSKPACVVVRSICPIFGKCESGFEALLYDKEESKQALEAEYMKTKNAVKEEKKEEEKPAETEESSKESSESEEKPAEVSEEKKE
ncbi:MAG: hypothetical protein ACOCWQ_02195 [Nanoarchaeota archaeon]